MKKGIKFFGIFIVIILVVSVIAALFDTEEETTEPEKVETSSPVEDKTEVEVEIEAEGTEEKVKTQTETIDVSTAIEAFKSNDFMKFANAFYGLTATERGDVFRSTVEGATVTWSGIITDLQTVKDSVIMMGKTDAYNGEDWITLNNDYIDLVPYVIIVEMNDPSVKEGLSKGDAITLTGEIGARGDIEMHYNWKLYKGEIAN